VKAQNLELNFGKVSAPERMENASICLHRPLLKPETGLVLFDSATLV
jgi:hypothetical protein